MSARPGERASHANPAREVFLPAAPVPWFVRWFERYSMRKLGRAFFAVRAHPAFAAHLADAATHPGPLIIVANHCSWWDPLVGLALLGRFMPHRSVRAPMDLAQLRRFGFFRRVGIFGVDPDSPASLAAMGGYIADYFRATPSPTLWITPQGRFADPRAPIELRPGAAALAAGAGERVRVLAIAMEYAFWSDQKPELFLRAEPVLAERPSTTGWHRAILAAMERNGTELAATVIARDPRAFVNLAGGDAAKTNPMWDLVLRLRGQAGSIDPTRHANRAPANPIAARLSGPPPGSSHPTPAAESQPQNQAEGVTQSEPEIRA